MFVGSEVEFTQLHGGVGKPSGISSDMVSTCKEQVCAQDFPIPIAHKKSAPEVREHLLSSYLQSARRNCLFARPEFSISIFNVWFDTSCSPDFFPFVHTKYNNIGKGMSQIP